MAHVGHIQGSVADMIFSVGPLVYMALCYRSSLRLSRPPRRFVTRSRTRRRAAPPKAGMRCANARQSDNASAPKAAAYPIGRPPVRAAYNLLYARPLAVVWSDPNGIWRQGGGTSRAIAAAEAGNRRIAQNRNVSTFRRVSGSGAQFRSLCLAVRDNLAAEKSNEERKDETYPP
jgi:hypothetical protein